MQTLRSWTGFFVITAGLLASTSAQAFCGFYVGKADSSLFNEASQVILVRDGDRTVISMLNDYKGDLKEFALVVPVPVVLERGQVNVGERKVFDRLDAYSAPRLAEYFDADPCRPPMETMMRGNAAPAAAPASPKSDAALGVRVEASYSVGEYDIVMLAANESDGLLTWLTRHGYKLPPNAANALAPYIRQGMKFFVAKVNLKEQAKTGFTNLRPLQFAFESSRFALPMRLGMLNAAGAQDLIVYALTRNGRVESSNYRTIKLPANMDLPVHVRSDFKSFYKSMFDKQAAREDYKAVFTEYFWDMSWCDPCAADPLSNTELRQAGVFWVDPDAESTNSRRLRPPMPGGAQPVMLTRLHIRYTKESFPEDLMLIQTGDRQNFQTRYVVRHAYKGSANQCDAARAYFRDLERRQQREAETLANLTGWDIDGIRKQMQITGPVRQWWENLWPRG